jgi:serine protease Do
MNIHLFSALKKDGNGPLSLSDGNAATRPTQATISDLAPSVPTDKVTIPMVQTPTVGEDQQPAPGLPLQQIYINNIPSVVSISCVSNNGRSSGTGVVVSENGFIVTNHHVIEDAEAISVLLSDDRTFRATLVGSDAISDLAVIYVEAEDLTPAQFGNSNDLMVGDSVCAIGDPLGSELRGTMTNGIVSAINRDITTGGRTMTLIQTNAALNSGNSGGPLIDRFGHIIGINTMKIGDNMSAAGVEGLGFAIPSTTVVDVIAQIIDQGYVSGRPSMGISGEPVSALYQYYYRLPAGLYVKMVIEGSDAAAQGLTPGDILISLNGKAVTSDEELTEFLYGCQVGDIVEAVIYRNKTRYTVKLTIEEAKG